MRRRNLLIAAATVTVVLAAGAGWLVARNGDDTPGEPACPYPTVSSGWGVGVPVDEAHTVIAEPSGGGVSVVETGFTQSADRHQVSIGAVVENTSSVVAYHTRVIFRAWQADGTTAINEDQQFLYFFEIPIILPGQRVPIGEYVNVDRATYNTTGRTIRVARAGLELITTRWVPAAETQSFPTVAVELPRAVPASGDGSMSVSFSATLNACRDMGARGATVLFRDSAGAIVGGSFDGDGKLGLCRAGEFTGSVLVFDDKLPRADLDRREVSVFCDVVGSSFLTPGLDQPNN